MLQHWYLNKEQQSCPTCGGVSFFQPEDERLAPICGACELERLRSLLWQKESHIDQLQSELDRVSYTYDGTELRVRVGDTVRCLRGEGEELLEGEAYRVEHISCGQIMVGGSNTYWQSHRFALVESADPRSLYED